jgi:hypothetical protein
MKRTVLVFVAMMGGLLASPGVEAAPDEATVKLARSHFDRGNAAYNLGKFEEAIGWFTRAYEAWPVPDFLYNIAQSYRLAGNCPQALFTYRRYLSIKEHEKGDPLGRDERAQIEQFIKELTDCDALTKAKPLGAKPPNQAPPASPQVRTSPPDPAPEAPAQDPAGASPGALARRSNPPAATVEKDAQADERDGAAGAPAARLVTAYATGGVAMFSTQGKLSIPMQPSFAAGAGYPVALGGLALDVGVRASYSPIPYAVMNTTARASLIGVRATVGATYRIGPRLGVRGDAGIGVAMLRGLVDGNAFTATGDAGAFTMLSLRVGIAAEYAVTPSLVATLAPLGVTFTQAPDALVMRSLTQLDVLVGLGYRL